MSDEPGPQSPDQGKDPNVVGPDDTKNMKMTGEGAPGSHSAVFGLTPDGKTHTDTSSTTTTIRPAHSAETAVGGGRLADRDGDRGNTSSEAVSGGGVASQMHDPNVAEKGHGGDAVESTAGPGEKAGAGTGTELGSQGSGQIGEQQSGGGLMDKAKSYLGGS